MVLTSTTNDVGDVQDHGTPGSLDAHEAEMHYRRPYRLYYYRPREYRPAPKIQSQTGE